jgi:hypothetical protein
MKYKRNWGETQERYWKWLLIKFSWEKFDKLREQYANRLRVSENQRNRLLRGDWGCFESNVKNPLRPLVDYINITKALKGRGSPDKSGSRIKSDPTRVPIYRTSGCKERTFGDDKRK